MSGSKQTSGLAIKSLQAQVRRCPWTLMVMLKHCVFVEQGGKDAAFKMR